MSPAHARTRTREAGVQGLLELGPGAAHEVAGGVAVDIDAKLDDGEGLLGAPEGQVLYPGPAAAVHGVLGRAGVGRGGPIDRVDRLSRRGGPAPRAGEAEEVRQQGQRRRGEPRPAFKGCAHQGQARMSRKRMRAWRVRFIFFYFFFVFLGSALGSWGCNTGVTRVLHGACRRECNGFASFWAASARPLRRQLPLPRAAAPAPSQIAQFSAAVHAGMRPIQSNSQTLRPCELPKRGLASPLGSGTKSSGVWRPGGLVHASGEAVRSRDNAAGRLGAWGVCGWLCVCLWKLD